MEVIMENNEFLTAGKIVSTHGIKGEVRLLPCCDSAEFVSKIKTLYLDRKAVVPLQKRIHKNLLLLTLPGYDSVDKAMSLIGKELFFKKSDVLLPRGVYFISDLVGLEVYDLRTNRTVGKITDVLQRPANNVYVVSGEKDEYLIPEAKEFIESVDLKKGVMTIKSIEGMV
jgi:16S rRNA processing protein RimM